MPIARFASMDARITIACSAGLMLGGAPRLLGLRIRELLPPRELGALRLLRGGTVAFGVVLAFHLLLPVRRLMVAALRELPVGRLPAGLRTAPLVPLAGVLAATVLGGWKP